MKKLIAILAVTVAFVACNNAGESTEKKADSTVAATADSVKAAATNAIDSVKTSATNAIDSVKAKADSAIKK